MTTSATKTVLAGTGGVAAALAYATTLAKVTPAQIAAHLTRLTGFGATILPDTTKTPGSSR